MVLVTKNVLFYLFINYNMFTFKKHPLCLHTTFPKLLPMFVAFLERSLWDVFEGLRSGTLDAAVDSKWCPFTASFTF